MKNNKALVTTTPATVVRPTMADAAATANRVSRAVVLKEYQDTKSPATIRRQMNDLDAFSIYLDEAGIASGDLQYDLSAWQGCDFGLVDGFKHWLVQSGYSIGTINVRLSTVKKYCTLAAKAGHIPPTTLALIREVKGYSGREAINVDEHRETTRIGKKKATWTPVDYDQAEALKALDNPRDALLMCLLLDHGLRCGEVSSLTVDNISLDGGYLKFHRRKVNLVQTHKLTEATLAAARAYVDNSTPHDRLFIAEGFNQFVMDTDAYREYSTRSINMHVAVLGKKVGIVNLSPHDCRHYWATRAVRRGTHVRNLQQAGGWKSPYMALRYAEESKIANEGVLL